MSIELTALIVSQAKAFVVMMAAGILTESFWQVKTRLQQGIVIRQLKSRQTDQRKAESRRVIFIGKVLIEGLFWAAAAIILSCFLYYSSYGKISAHTLAGYLIGLLLWKKILHCVILCPWEENDEAQNSKITARSSIWMKREDRGWRKDRRKEKRKKRK